MSSIAIEEMEVQQIVFALAEQTTIKMIREETKLSHDEIWKAAQGKASKKVYKGLRRFLEHLITQDEKDLALDALIYQKQCEVIFFPDYDDKPNLTNYSDKHGV